MLLLEDCLIFRTPRHESILGAEISAADVVLRPNLVGHFWIAGIEGGGPGRLPLRPPCPLSICARQIPRGGRPQRPPLFATGPSRAIFQNFNFEKNQSQWILLR